MKRSYLVFGIFFGVLMICSAQQTVTIKKVDYKTIDSVSLSMDIYYPAGNNQSKSYPVMIYFFGGGWVGGSISQFQPHAEYFAQRGLVCALADYRVKSRQGTSPFESLKDAKSAIRYLRKNAKELQIDKDKIIAAGGSAGGHLAAATAIVTRYDEDTDDLTISPVPNALVLFNPVIDNGPGGYGFDRVGEAYQTFSPLHNLRRGTPPTIFFLGTADRLIPVETAKYYQMVMQRVGGRCDLHLYEDQPHGFFNFQRKEYFVKTVREADKFLSSLGFIKGEPIESLFIK